MTQQLHDEQVDPWEYPDTVKADLLSLRAAVRRVIESCKQEREEGALSKTMVLQFIEDALRAEMAGIDGKEQKP